MFSLLTAALAPISSIVSGVDMGYAGPEGLTVQTFSSGNTPCGYICYGAGEFDGQGSGHDAGNVYHPSVGYVNSCDGGRSHTFCDYRQQ
mmetsp:Transcript_6144/g.14613  ORF Transcript_6144/g.14613 Transcript_6144/m.14613 type:complete len:89 (+) Transcript_6144:41-307(+)